MSQLQQSLKQECSAKDPSHLPDTRNQNGLTWLLLKIESKGIEVTVLMEYVLYILRSYYYNEQPQLINMNERNIIITKKEDDEGEEKEEGRNMMRIYLFVT